MSQFSMMHIKEDTEMKLLLWSKIILWSHFEYQKNPTKMDNFHLLLDERGMQDPIHLKEERNIMFYFEKIVLQEFPS